MKRLANCIHDPCRFVELCWPKINLYTKQKEILYSLVDNKETFVHACNKSGKSFIAGLAAVWFFASRQPARVVASAPTQEQLRVVLFSEIKNNILESQYAFPFEILTDKIEKLDAEGNKLPKDYIKGTVTSTVEAFQGHHLPLDKPRVLAIFDESSAVEDEFYEASYSWSHRTLCISNPLSTVNFFFHQCEMGDEADESGATKLTRKVMKISALDSPNVQLGIKLREGGFKGVVPKIVEGVITYSEYIQRMNAWNETQIKTRLLGEFDTGSRSKLFPADWLSSSYRLHEEHHSKTKKRQAVAMGVDTGEGRDLTVITVVDYEGVIEIISKRTPDTSEIPLLILETANKYAIPSQNILMDVGGGGRQIADQLRKMGMRGVETVSFSSTPRSEKTKSRRKKRESDEMRTTYKNRRAELYGQLREYLDPKFRTQFAIPNIKELHEELEVIPLIYDPEGRMVMIPKKEPPKLKEMSSGGKEVTLRYLLGRSPDHSDSLVMAVDVLYRNKGMPNFAGHLEKDEKGNVKTTKSLEERIAEMQAALADLHG